MRKRDVASQRKGCVRVLQLSKVPASPQSSSNLLKAGRESAKSHRIFFTSSFQPEQSEEGDPRPEAIRHHIVHRGYGLAVLQCKSSSV